MLATPLRLGTLRGGIRVPPSQAPGLLAGGVLPEANPKPTQAAAGNQSHGQSFIGETLMLSVFREITLAVCVLTPICR